MLQLTLLTPQQYTLAVILIILESLTEYSYTEWWKRQIDRAAKLIVCLSAFLSL